MNILLQNRYDALTHRGGDTYQMLLTKKYLEAEGVSVDISTELTPDLSNYDLVHLFNITRVHETYVQFRNAKKQHKKVVLSPIYHSMADIRNYERKNLAGIHGSLIRIFGSTDRIQLLKTLYYVSRYPGTWYSALLQCWKGYTFQQREVLRCVDCILPNSRMEMQTICDELFRGESVTFPHSIVYNGIDDTEHAPSPEMNDWLRARGIKDYILCAGRIEPRKNQNAIMDAMGGSKLPVIFVGRLNTLHARYVKRFLKRIDNEYFFYIPETLQEGVMTLFQSAKVAVLASWFETTGLTGIEAGKMGCNVVITEKGYTREYYQDHAWYCDPESVSSIAGAIQAAYDAPRNSRNMTALIGTLGLTWKEAAHGTLDAYKRTLG